MKTLKSILMLVLVALVFTSCASVTPELVGRIKNRCTQRVDPISIQDEAKFQADMNECATLAAQAHVDAFNRAMGNAIIGAAAGAAIGAGVSGRWNSSSTRVGAVAGAAGGVARTPNFVDRVMFNCLYHRGYLLLY